MSTSNPKLDFSLSHPTSEEDFYKILGCSEFSNSDQISLEYKRLALQFHPDKNSDATSGERFVLINRAFQILSDESKRKDYDSWLHSGIDISYADWLQMSEQKRLFHWRSEKTQPTIDLPKSSSYKTPAERGSLLDKFRNYEI